MSFFEELHRNLLTVPLGTVVKFRLPAGVHPRDYGAVQSIGLDKGQDEDWRFPPDSAGQGMHLHKYKDGLWTAHIDRYHPDYDFLEHLRYDAPGAHMALFGAIGGGLGLLFAPKKKEVEWTWTGALIGLAAGFATRRTDDQKYLPERTRPAFLAKPASERASELDQAHRRDPRNNPRTHDCRYDPAPTGLEWNPYG